MDNGYVTPKAHCCKSKKSKNKKKKKSKNKGDNIPLCELVPSPIPSSEAAAESVAEPAAESIAEPVAGSTTESVTKPATEPVIEPVTELTTEPTTEPVVEPVTESVVETVAELVTKPSAEPATEPDAQIAAKPAAQIVDQPDPQPDLQPNPQPDPQADLQSDPQPTCQKLQTIPSENEALPTPVAKATKAKRPRRTKTAEVIEDPEYRPVKVKRSSPRKKTALKQTFKLKEIKNKRKSSVPRKGVQVEEKDPHRVELSELSVFEITRYLDENGLLDDECFIEIMNCPSPVWWEDPPDEDFCEDPIDPELVREALEGGVVVGTSAPPPIVDEFQIRVQMWEKKRKPNEKFFKKKNKLENILGNLKNRVRKINNVSASDAVICIDGADKQGADANRGKSECRLSESSEGDILSDISVNEEELLKHLETIQIPVKKTLSIDVLVKRDLMAKIKPTVVPETMPSLLKFPYQSANADFTRLKSLTNAMKSKNGLATATCDSSQPSSDCYSKESTSSDFSEVRTLKVYGNPKRKSCESSKSLSFSDDNVSGDIDSISDTNVRFLDDDDVEMLSCSDAPEPVCDDMVLENTSNVSGDHRCGDVNVDGDQLRADENTTVEKSRDVNIYDEQDYGDVNMSGDYEQDINLNGEEQSINLNDEEEQCINLNEEQVISLDGELEQDLNLVCEHEQHVNLNDEQDTHLGGDRNAKIHITKDKTRSDTNCEQISSTNKSDQDSVNMVVDNGQCAPTCGDGIADSNVADDGITADNELVTVYNIVSTLRDNDADVSGYEEVTELEPEMDDPSNRK